MIRALREEVASVVRDAVGAGYVEVYDWVPSNAVTPYIFVDWPEDIDYRDGTLSGRRLVTLPITFVVGLEDSYDAQTKLDDLMSATIPDALATHEGVTYGYLELRRFGNVRVENQRLLADLTIGLRA